MRGLRPEVRPPILRRWREPLRDGGGRRGKGDVDSCVPPGVTAEGRSALAAAHYRPTRRRASWAEPRRSARGRPEIHRRRGGLLSQRYAAFLRGVNLGRRRVTNEALCRAFAAADLPDARAFLASGNVVFDAPPTDEAVLRARLEPALAGALGWEVVVFLRTADEVRRVVRARPFGEPTEGAWRAAPCRWACSTPRRPPPRASARRRSALPRTRCASSG
ncbi:MAG: DUF1697 domain-containing protein, partial [Gemmatimonadetes bacterium]